MNKNDDLTKHTLYLFKGDFEKLRDLHPEFGASYAVRRVVRTYIERLETRLKEGTKTGPIPLDVDI